MACLILAAAYICNPILLTKSRFTLGNRGFKLSAHVSIWVIPISLRPSLLKAAPLIAVFASSFASPYHAALSIGPVCSTVSGFWWARISHEVNLVHFFVLPWGCAIGVALFPSVLQSGFECV